MSHKINTTISEATRQCANAFTDSLLRAVSGQEVHDLPMLKEHHARFIIWTEELGVSSESNSSPEDHLHYALDAKNVIVKLLQQLKATLEVILSHNANSPIPDQPAEANDEEQYSSDSSLGISEDDDMDGELELATESHFNTNKHIQVIGEIISHLYRFTSIVEQQNIHAEDQRINQWALEKGPELEHQLKGLELYISYSLDRDFPTLQPFLRNRLIHTVTHRRRRLLYQQDHSVKLDSSVRGSSNSKTKEPASGYQDVQDFRPYICLFQNCNTPLRQLATMNDWINHMSSQHAQVWVCQAKGHEGYVFQNSADLGTHLQKEHYDVVHTYQIPFLTAKSAKAGSDILGALAAENPEIIKGSPVCPFCNLNASTFESKSQLATPTHCLTTESSRETYQKAYDHISGHLKLIAHESLPPALQAPQPISLRKFNIAIICDSSLIDRAVYRLFNAIWNMDHLFQKPVGDLNSYSFGAIGRHSVVLVHISKTGIPDHEEVFPYVRRSFPCIELFMVADMCDIMPLRSNDDINFGDVIVGDRVEQNNVKERQHSAVSSSNHKPRTRVRSLLANMRTFEVRQIVQQRMSTNIEVLGKYRSIAARHHSSGPRESLTQVPEKRDDLELFPYTFRPMRQTNQNPEPHFHFGAVVSSRLSVPGHSLPLFRTIEDRYNFTLVRETAGESLEPYPCLFIQSTCAPIADGSNTDEWENYAAATAAAFTSVVIDLWPSSISTESSVIHNPAYRIPIPKNEDFVHHNAYMDTLKDIVFRDCTEQVAIIGLDGIGKTQLALWLAYWVKDNIQGYSVFWAAAMSTETFEQECHRILKSLGHRCTGGNDPKVALQRYLSSDSAGRWILILDGASDEDLTYGKSDHPFDISNFLPNNRKGLIVVTTTMEEVASAGDAVVTLHPMSWSLSLHLLGKSLVGKSHDKPLMKELLGVIPDAPMMVSLVAAYINANEVPISSYIELLEDVTRRTTTFFGTSYISTFRIFCVSIDYIEEHHTSAARILHFFAFFGPKPVRRSILPGTENVQEFRNGIRTLRKYELLRMQFNTGMLDFSIYVYDATARWIKIRDIADRHRGAIAAHLVRILTPDNLESRQLWNQHLPQVLKLLTDAKHFNHGTSTLGCLVGRYLHQNGRVEEAIEVFGVLLKSQSDALSEDVACYLTLEFELARAYRCNLQAQEAVDLLEHVVAMRDATLAESHPDRLASQRELAMTYQENGQHGQAAELLEHLTAVREKTDVEDSPDLLQLEHQLANAYLSTGKLDEGNKLLEHVKTVEGKPPSDEHPEQNN